MSVETTTGAVIPNQLSVDELSDSLKRFGTADYAVFVTMLICCSMVGLFFGYQDHKKRKQPKDPNAEDNGALDYLMGGRNMQVFPVAMSLVASFVSGITLLGKLK
jgi:solute carrier family 5 (sodium-coupled monocarboxylate transporter), member 8/12